MSRIVGAAMFLAVLMGVTSHAEAQSEEGQVARPGQVSDVAPHANRRRVRGRNLQQRFLPRLLFGDTSHNANPNAPLSYDPVLYPKYIGGFHSSEFNNLGVPPGDIGFRGNSILWTPW